MATLEFTPNIQRHVACPRQVVDGATIREVLDAAFADNPRARSYVLDDQNCLRKHINIFLDGVLITDRVKLSDPVTPQSSIYVFQALSGG